MKSQFVGGGQNGLEQYLNWSLNGMVANNGPSASPELIATIKSMKDFAAANPDKVNGTQLNAWVEKVLGSDEPPTKAAAPTTTKKPGIGNGF